MGRLTQFSANLGFLWTERPLPDAIRAAKAACFDAVECHWPYDIPAAEVSEALKETDLTMLGLNTRRGNVAAGDNGLTAIPGREGEARAAIDEAIRYGAKIGAANVHVMAGFASGAIAQETFIENLRYACDTAKDVGITVLIEPLNPYDAPGYFLSTTAHAVEIIRAVSAENLKLMFDCYHVERTEGRVVERLSDVFQIVGHIQFASVPDRGAPDGGSLDYGHVFDQIRMLGWTAPLGAEYKPEGETDASLGWMASYR